MRGQIVMIFISFVVTTVIAESVEIFATDTYDQSDYRYKIFPSIKKKTTFFGEGSEDGPSQCVGVSTWSAVRRRKSCFYNDFHPFRDFNAPYVDFIDSIFLHMAKSSNVSDRCRNDTELLFSLAYQNNKSALKILDATGKFLSGVLEGGIVFPGLYSQCISVSSAVEESGEINLPFSGQYCALSVNMKPAPILTHDGVPPVIWDVIKETRKPIFIGLCVPSSCTLEEVTNSSNTVSSVTFLGSTAEVSSCHSMDTEAKFVWFAAEGAFLAFLFLYGAHVLSATFIDMYYNLAEDFPFRNSEQGEGVSKRRVVFQKFMWAFSLRTSTSAIFRIKISEGYIAPLDGLKVISMMLIVLGHTYSFGMSNLFIRNQLAATNAPKSGFFSVFSNVTLPVDTFFFITGTLAAFLSSKVRIRHILDPFRFCFHRYIRLAPLLLMIIAGCVILLRHVGSGPNWVKAVTMFDFWCRTNWWINLTFMQNWINTENMCLSHSWYIANDMQFMVVTLILFLILQFNLFAGGVMLLLAITFSGIATFVITYKNDYPAIPIFSSNVSPEKMHDFFKYIYIKPYSRYAAYGIGLAFGYALAVKKNSYMSRLVAVGLGALGIASGLWVIFGMQRDEAYMTSAMYLSLYSALSRPVWAISVACLVALCFYGYGGIIDLILSWKPLQVLSKLTYSAYLIHPILINASYGLMETPVQLTTCFMLYMMLGTVLLTYSSAFVLSVLFEQIVFNLERAFSSEEMCPNKNPATAAVTTEATSDGTTDDATVETPPRRSQRA